MSAPAETSVMANWMASYVMHSTYQPIKGQRHPFNGMSHEQIATLIQADLDNLARAEREKVGLLREALEKSNTALYAASRDIHESLQVAIMNLTGKGRDGFNYGIPNPPLLVHERGIARSEAVEKMVDNQAYENHQLLISTTPQPPEQPKT